VTNRQKSPAKRTTSSDGVTAGGKIGYFFRNPKAWSLVLCLALVGSLGYQHWTDPLRYFERGVRAAQESDQRMLQSAIKSLEGHREFQLHRKYLQAKLALLNGDISSVVALADEAKQHPDLSLEAGVLAGEAAYKLGAAGNAKLYWEEALRIDGQYVPAHQWMGVLYYDLGAMDTAMMHLQAVSRLSPTDYRPDRLMGLMNRDYERPEIAVPHYQESLRRAPQQPDANEVRMELAECHLKLREYEVALKVLDQCSESSKKSLLRARCLMNVGLLEEARQIAKSLINVEGVQRVESLQLNAEIALADSNSEEAANLLRKAIEADPYNHSVRTQLAQVLGRLGEAEASKEQTEQAKRLQEVWQRFSDLQVDAIDRPTDADIRFEIGQLAGQLGKPQLAEVWYKAALAINPSMRVAADALQQLTSTPPPAAKE
jgi:tetratricopeptide (TPR) repeat protein